MKTATSIVTNSNNNFASDADVEDALRHGRIISNIVRPESRRFRRDTIPITIETSLNQEPYIDTKQRITDFRNQIEIDHVSDVNDIISYVQPYLEPMMIIPKEPGVSTIPDCSCLAPPDVPMTRYKDVFAGISLYIEDGVNVTKSMLNRATRLATIIAGLASEVYKLPIETMHLYRDVNGGGCPRRICLFTWITLVLSFYLARVAFNHRNSLFINLRYFEQVFADRFDSETHASAALNPTSENIGNFYFMVICHLLTHNKYRNHDATFIRHLEEIVIKFLPAQGLFLPLIPYC